MKIAIITAGILPVPPVKGGAVENLVYSFIKQNELSNHPIEIEVYGIESEENVAYPKNQSYTKYHNIKIGRTHDILEKTKISPLLRLLFKKYKNYPYLYKVLKILKKNKYDYIVVENRPWFIEDIKKVTEDKIILHMHNDHLCLNIKENKSVIEICHKILVVSDYLKRQILTHFQVEDNKVIVLENGINHLLFTPNLEQTEIDELRKKMNIKKSDFLVVFSGRLIKEKGILEVINSFKLLSHLDDLKLLIMGANTYSSDLGDPFTQELVSLSESIKDKIIFTGYIDYYNMPNYYNIGDIALLPSIWQEPSGLVILEAMSMKLPIITTNVGGIPELIRDKGYVLDLDSNLQTNIVEAIKELYSDEKLRMRLGDEARSRVIQYYTEEVYYQNFVNALIS